MKINIAIAGYMKKYVLGKYLKAVCIISICAVLLTRIKLIDITTKYISVILTSRTMTVASSIPDVDEYWPEVAEDLSQVTWSHATNSQLLLQESLNNATIMMIEADVLYGCLSGSSPCDPKIPIMAHPPNLASDLSLEMFISEIILFISQNGGKKGIKLDFKELDVVEPSLHLLTAYVDQLTFPIWLNADILPGPVNATAVPLDPQIFLSTCVEFFPQATLSVGWTTRFTYANDSGGEYSLSTVNEMISVLESNQVTQPVTFPIRAAFVERSIDSLTHLVDSVPDSTVTVWSSASDDVNIASLVWLQESLGSDRAYFDLPPDQQKEFDNLKPHETAAFAPSSAPTVKFWPKNTLYWTNISCGLAIVISAVLYFWNGNGE